MDVEGFRGRYRRTSIPGDYNGRLNVVMNLIICGLSAVVSATRADTTASSVGAFLLTFALFNVSEYTVHRWVSHAPRFRAAYRRHVGEHHAFFPKGHMSSDRSEDIHVTVLPTKTLSLYLILFLICWVLPVGLVAGPAAGAAAALAVSINVATLDLLHYYYHLGEDSPVTRRLSRWPYLAALRSSHKIHHGTRMSYNFNITHPWCDVLFGTKYKDRRE